MLPNNERHSETDRGCAICEFRRRPDTVEIFQFRDELDTYVFRIDQVKEIKRSMTEFEGVEQERVKQMAAMYDAMAPENAAKIMQQLADTGQIETAVKVLATMKERQAARVLAELPDPSMAATLLDKMRTLKKPSPQTTKK